MRAARATALAASLLCSGCATTPPLRPSSAPAAAEPSSVVTLVRERLFDASLAAAWAERHRGLDERDHAAVRAALAELGVSHTDLITQDDPRHAAMRAIFALPDPRDARGSAIDRERVEAWSIGVDAARIGDRWFVRSVVPGGSAGTMGIVRGDEIVAADGKPFEPVGSLEGRDAIELTIRREQGGATVERIVPVRRGSVRAAWRDAIGDGVRVITSDEVEPAMRVGVLALFAGAGLDMLAEIERAISGPLRHADALVLDLRDGFGGCTPEYVRPFLREVPTLAMVDRIGRRTVVDPQWRGPLVLLVNGGTRSGKEMVARSLQRSGRAVLVGERTAGAVLGGSAFMLADGSILYLAVLDAFVDGERLEGVGVEPDVVVPADLPYAAGRDPQLEAALRVAKELARSERAERNRLAPLRSAAPLEDASSAHPNE